MTAGLPIALGWLGVAAIAVGLASMALAVRQPGVIGGERAPGPVQLLGIAASMVAIVAWQLWLASTL